MTQLIDQYLVESTSRMAALKDAVERRDAPALRLATHSLKGTSSTVGANRLAAICEELETLARATTLDGSRRWSSQSRMNSPVSAMHSTSNGGASTPESASSGRRGVPRPEVSGGLPARQSAAHDAACTRRTSPWRAAAA